eukprot:NODE_303_length_11391_cov_0.177028.p3 type:complete len:282 gc:universal NODE_303_length_11391_cov_0.177028:3307-2462(-)
MFNFENFHKQPKNIFPAPFKGLRADITKNFSQNFSVMHNIGDNYQFGSMFLDDNVFMQSMVGISSGLFRLNRMIFDNKSSQIVAKAQHQINTQGQQTQTEVEYISHANCANAKWIPGVLNSIGYLHKVSEKFIVGLEVYQAAELGASLSFHHSGSNILENKEAAPPVPVGFTYQPFLSPEFCLSITKSPSNQTLTASYAHPLSDKVSLASELTVSPNGSMTQTGARYIFQQAMIKVGLDTMGKVSSVMEYRLMPGITIGLSGELDHFKGEQKAGISLTMEQ